MYKGFVIIDRKTRKKFSYGKKPVTFETSEKAWEFMEQHGKSFGVGAKTHRPKYNGETVSINDFMSEINRCKHQRSVQGALDLGNYMHEKDTDYSRVQSSYMIEQLNFLFKFLNMEQWG